MLYAVPITSLRPIYMYTTRPSMICEGKRAREQYAERSRHARGTQVFAREPFPQSQLPPIPDIGLKIYFCFKWVFVASPWRCSSSGHSGEASRRLGEIAYLHYSELSGAIHSGTKAMMEPSISDDEYRIKIRSLQIYLSHVNTTARNTTP
jgi:hypothetical protein